MGLAWRLECGSLRAGGRPHFNVRRRPLTDRSLRYATTYFYAQQQLWFGCPVTMEAVLPETPADPWRSNSSLRTEALENGVSLVSPDFLTALLATTWLIMILAWTGTESRHFRHRNCRHFNGQFV
jgi:hypothetical protein